MVHPAALMQDTELRKAFGARLKALRKAKRWSQKELAGKVDIRFQQLNKYESGLNVPPADMLVKLADALATSVDYLLTGNARSVLPFSVFMGVYVLAGLIANFILCAVWSGFDAPMSLTALRLGAVGSLYIALQLLTAAVLPPSILLLIIPIMSATVLALVLLDLEPVEALVLTILTGAIAFGLVQALISLGLRSL